jgi:hypothetical protein
LQPAGGAYDNAILAQAIGVYRDVLLERTRERVPLDWLMTQNNRAINRSLPSGLAIAAARASAIAGSRSFRIGAQW